jgi:hypothetical protein
MRTKPAPQLNHSEKTNPFVQQAVTRQLAWWLPRPTSPMSAVLLVQLAKQRVHRAGPLEPLRVQTHRGNAGRRRAHHAVTLQLPHMAGDSKHVGLAGAGLADHHAHPLAALGDVADHRGLVLPDGRMRRQRLAQRVVGAHAGLLASAADGGVDQALLDPEQLRGGVVALPDGVLAHHADRAFAKEPIRQPLQLGRANLPGDLGGQLPPHRAQHLGPGERRRLRGQPLGARQPVKHLADGPLGQSCRHPARGVRGTRCPVGMSRSPTRCVCRRAVPSHGPGRVLLAGPLPPGHLAHQPLRLKPQLAGLLPPTVVQRLGRLVRLGRASLMHHLLHQLRRATLALLGLLTLQLRADLLMPLRQGAAQLLRHPRNAAVAPQSGASHRTPSERDSSAW